MLLVFAGIGHDTQRLAAGISAAAPGVPVIGCSTHREIEAGGPHDGTVVVTALGSDGFSVATLHGLRRDDPQVQSKTGTSKRWSTATSRSPPPTP